MKTETRQVAEAMVEEDDILAILREVTGHGPWTLTYEEEHDYDLGGRILRVTAQVRLPLKDLAATTVDEVPDSVLEGLRAEDVQEENGHVVATITDGTLWDILEPAGLKALGLTEADMTGGGLHNWWIEDGAGPIHLQFQWTLKGGETEPQDGKNQVPEKCQVCSPTLTPPDAPAGHPVLTEWNAARLMAQALAGQAVIGIVAVPSGMRNCCSEYIADLADGRQVSTVFDCGCGSDDGQPCVRATFI